MGNQDMHIEGSVGGDAIQAGRDVNIYRMDKDTGVVLQNLRDFTVQIRSASDDAIVGTGVVVSMDGRVVTCAHVVQQAIGKHPRDAKGAEVGVYFPQARGGEVKDRRATVQCCFKQHDDDVALLQLVGGPAPLAPEQIAVLGKAEPSFGNHFRSYGYPTLESSVYQPYVQSLFAHGEIMGSVETKEQYNFHAELVQLQSDQLDRGMSGSAVLDTKRNLVVGIVSGVWINRLSPKNPGLAWSVNASVLTFDPFMFELLESYPLGSAPTPRTDVEKARRSAAPEPGISLNNAPAPIPEWVGRVDMLKAITRDWQDPTRRVTGLIGFGGEGKSSLARRWLDDLLGGDTEPKPDGVFWWGFYDRPSADEFFEAALEYMIGGRIDPQQVLSAGVKAQIIGAMLGTKRYVFVLDGLEVLQHQGGDNYGLLKSADVRSFLELFAAPGHESFCVVTSRAPLADLMGYTTYTHRDVTRLSADDGRALLREVGVRGTDDALDKVVAQWDGHALTLSLLGSYLAERHGGDVAHVGEIPAPTADEPRYDRVHRVLHRYDKHLSDEERDFMTIFGAFRVPVLEDAFEGVFRADMPDADFGAIVERLMEYGMLRRIPDGRHTAHPLVRSHYAARLQDAPNAADVHRRIKDYYLQAGGEPPEFPTLDDLAPFIEAVHHACRAGDYDEAFDPIYWEHISQRERYTIVHQLGAYETALALMLEFFPDGDTTKEPGVSSPEYKSWILNAIGLRLMSLGRPGEAVPFYERGNIAAVELENWHNASIGYGNLAELHAHLGALDASAEAAGRALELARRAENKRDERTSLAYRAWAAHLRGELEQAGADFTRAEALEREITPQVQYLYSLRGIQHAGHLRRAGDADHARRVTDANLQICEQHRVAEQISQCHRVLGDLDADAGSHESAHTHYDEALKIARSITEQAVLTEALLARGRWYARHTDDSAAAFGDLNEALGYAEEGGYRIYEADARAALAWAHRAAGNAESARAEAERALQMSRDMGYHWGIVDAGEVLGALTSRQSPRRP